MAKIGNVKVEVSENSLQNNRDRKLVGVADEGSYPGGGVTYKLFHMDSNEPDDPVSPRSVTHSGCGVTYKLVHMDNNDPDDSVSPKSMTHSYAGGDYYVIENPMEVFGTTAEPKKPIPRVPSLENKPVSPKKRDDKRRATHNEVERRRRDKINSWITKLGMLLPNSGPSDAASKGGILAKACEHIVDLTEKQKRFERLEMDNNKMILEIISLNQEISALRKENASMRSQLGDNCMIPNHRMKSENS